MKLKLEEALVVLHEETLDADNAAEKLGYLPKTFRSRIDRGQVEVVRIGAAVRVPRVEVDRLAGLLGQRV